MNIAPSIDVAGQNILITGVAEGIGRELAIMLHKYGANIIGLDFQTTKLLSLSETLNDQRFHPISFDLRSMREEDYS
ncbi:SDR family oxidoreductase, partial [Klebsiella pneumoniae]|nr:SDR family oxidoreductase [Klebsiella pneumoniae]